MAFWISFLDRWIDGFLDRWITGFPEDRLSRILALWNSTTSCALWSSGITVFWTYGQTGSESMFWNTGMYKAGEMAFWNGGGRVMFWNYIGVADENVADESQSGQGV